MTAKYRINIFSKQDDSGHQQVRRNQKMYPGPQVGDTVEHPSTGPFTVTKRSKRYVSGTAPNGTPIGETGVGLLTGRKLGS